MAVLTAIEHPEIVAGLVLLDPTPINDAAGCARLERVFTAADRLTGVAPVHALMRAGLRTQLRPECAEALEKNANLDISRLAASVRGISRLSAEFPQQLPQLPAVMAA